MEKRNQDLESHFIKEGNKIGHNEGWRYFLGLLFSMLLGQVLGIIPYFITLSSLRRKEGILAGELAIPGIGANWNFLLMMLPFMCSFFLLYIYIKRVHKRPFRSVITPFRKLNYAKFLYAFGVWMFILVVFELIYYAGNPGNYMLQFNFSKFAILLLLSIPVLLIQTSYEELIFRGYGMQWLGRYMPYRIVPLLMTSFGFGLMHISNPEVAAFGPMVIIDYIVIGLTLGLVSLLSDSLEFAMGLHFANNLFAALFLSYDSSVLQTDAVFRLKEVNFSPNTQLLGVCLAIIFILLIHLKYPLKPLRMLWTKDVLKTPA